MRLSQNFDLSEFTASQTASRLGIDNAPSAAELSELQRTAELMEKVRSILGGRVVIITSGFRGQRLNDNVPGSSKTSAHVWGGAADFICPGYGSPLEICRELATYGEALQFDQLIYEFTWVHIGRSRDGRPRRQLLVIGGGVTRDVTREGFPS